MYSSRRHTNRYYSRSYNRKKRINKKFSPAAYKNNVPTYFQQKGRIIQTSPLRLYQVPRQLPNMNTLNNMYNLLLKAKYPNVGPVDPPTPTPPPEPPAPPIQPYLVSFSITATDLYNLTSHRLYPSDLAALTETNTDLSPLPYGWEYQFDLYTIQFRQYLEANYTDTSLFHIDLVNPIILSDPTPFQMVLKTTATTSQPQGANVVWLSSFIPVDSHSAKINRAVYTTGGITTTISTVSTTDNDITDNGWYPFVSTALDTGEDPPHYIEYVANNSDIPPLNLLLNVMCTPIEAF